MDYKTRIITSFVITLLVALLAYEAGAGRLQYQVVAGIVVISLIVCMFLERRLAMLTFLVAMLAFLAGTGAKVAPQAFLLIGGCYVVTFVIKFIYNVFDF